LIVSFICTSITSYANNDDRRLSSIVGLLTTQPWSNSRGQSERWC